MVRKHWLLISIIWFKNSSKFQNTKNQFTCTQYSNFITLSMASYGCGMTSFGSEVLRRYLGWREMMQTTITQ